jgi:hypothetical protein
MNDKTKLYKVLAIITLLDGFIQTAVVGLVDKFDEVHVRHYGRHIDERLRGHATLRFRVDETYETWDVDRADIKPPIEIGIVRVTDKEEIAKLMELFVVEEL